jgi:hypothetical protein
MDNMVTSQANVFSLINQSGLKKNEEVTGSSTITFDSLLEQIKPSAFIPLRIISEKINLDTG